jgi:hypothetical protein
MEVTISVRGYQFKIKIMRDSNENKPIPQSDIDKLFSGEISQKEFEKKYEVQEDKWLKGHLKLLVGSIGIVWILISILLYDYLMS